MHATAVIWAVRTGRSWVSSSLMFAVFVTAARDRRRSATLDRI
jgi:hypothetical protein